MPAETNRVIAVNYDLQFPGIAVVEYSSAAIFLSACTFQFTSSNLYVLLL
jgi:hypothetical protein